MESYTFFIPLILLTVTQCLFLNKDTAQIAKGEGANISQFFEEK